MISTGWPPPNIISTVHHQGLNDKGGGRKCFTYATGLEGILNSADDTIVIVILVIPIVLMIVMIFVSL